MHKKFTYKKGKRFGPYYYETKRVNGKIVTTYLGRSYKEPEKKFNITGSIERTIRQADSRKTLQDHKYKSVLGVLGFVFILAVLLLLFFSFPREISGKASLDIDANYLPGELITGKLNLILNEGELIPSDSLVVVTLGSEVREYSLSDLVSEEVVEGGFYVEDFNIGGSGSGYGIAGVKEIYPEVSFDLRIFGEEVSESSGDSSESGVGEGELDNESEEVDEGIEETPESDKGSGDSESSLEEDGATEKSSDSDDSGDGEESSSNDGSGASSSSESSLGDSSDSGDSGESDGGGSDGDSSGDSGESVTGSVISDEEFIVSGTVVKGESFEYNLEQGQKAELVAGSVKVNGEIKGEVDLEISEGKIIVSTDYFIEEHGFGEEFLGDEHEIEVSIDDLGFVAESDSVLKIEVIYNENILVEVEKDISVEEIEEVNETIKAVNQTLLNESVEFISVNTTQVRAVLGEPVKWIKTINATKPTKIVVEIPSTAGNISIKKVDEELDDEFEEVEESESDEEVIQAINESEETNGEVEEVDAQDESDNISITGGVISDFSNAEEDVASAIGNVQLFVDEEKKQARVGLDGSIITGRLSAEIETKNEGLFSWFRRLLSITGFAVSEDPVEIVVDVNDSNGGIFEIEYYTDAPYVDFEEETEKEKIIRIAGPDDVHYEDVLIFTNLNESMNITDPGSVRVYWEENDTFVHVLNLSDNNEDGIYDYIEWIAPHLSSQTFRIIIITNAEHLNESRDVVSDIYQEVKAQDGIWSEEIPAGHYVRVRFESNLTSLNDISIYPRITSGTPKVEIYEINGTEKIAEFSSIKEEVYNRVLLDDLEGQQDSFDLLVLDGGLEFDHIIDPVILYIRANDTGNTSVANPGTVNFTGMLNTSYSVLIQPQASADSQYSNTFLSKGTTGFEIKTEDAGGLNDVVEAIYWAALSYGEYDLGSDKYIKCGEASTNTTNNYTLIYNTPFPDANYSVICTPADHTDSPLCGVKLQSQITIPKYANNVTFWNDEDAGTPINVSFIDWCAFSYGEYTFTDKISGGSVKFKANTSMQEKGVLSGNFTTAFSNTDYVAFITNTQNSTNDLCACEISNRYVASFSAVCFDDNPSVANCDNRSFDWVAFSKGDVNLTFDTTAPLVTINFPTNTTYTPYSLPLNFNISLDEEGSVFYSLNNGATNVTMYNGTNVMGSSFNATNSSIADGGYTFRVYANDTVGNKNHTESVTFSMKGFLDACGTLNMENTTYVLQKDLTTTSTCFTITANNVTLDLNGYEINDSTLSQSDFGVNISGYNKSTVKNGRIENFGRGISADRVYNATFINLTIVFNGTLISSSLSGINISRGGENNITANNVSVYNPGSGSESNAIRIELSQKNWIVNNYVPLTLRGNNLILFQSDYNVIEGGVFENSSGFDHIVISSSSNNTLRHFTVKGAGFNKISITGASSANNNITNLTIESDLTAASYDLKFQTAGINGTYLIDNHGISNYSFTGLGGKVNFKDSTFGVIEFLGMINGSNGNLTENVRIANNSVTVLSNVNSGLNKTANITLYGTPGVGLSNPQILRDGSACPTSICNNFTALTAATVVFNVSYWTNYSIGSTANVAPTTPTPEINTTDLSNKTLQDVHCYDNLIDPNGDNMNATVRWYNNSVLAFTYYYNNSYANNTFFDSVLANGNTTKGQQWHCGIVLYDGALASAQGNSTNLTILNTAPVVTLASPADGNVTTDRTPTFSWTSSDDDGDTVSYELNLTCFSSAGGSCNSGSDNRYVQGITSTSHDIVGDLQFLSDNGFYYNWTVRANDSEQFGSWATWRNISIQSVITISLPNSSIEFGNIEFTENNDTSDNSPLPFLIQNDGNAFVNVTIEATNLWGSQANPNSNYRFKVDNLTIENGSFNWGSSVTNYTNVPASGSPSLCIARLNYTDVTDTAEIDINITVPTDEGSGVRSSTATFVSSLAE